MCGRLNFTPGRELRQTLLQLGIELPPPPMPQLDIQSAQSEWRWNIAPTEAIQVLCDIDGRRVWPPMRWWLHPHWSREEPNQKFAMFNARAETIASSRAYKGPFQYRRGIVLADSFLEWQKQGQAKHPWLIEAADQAPLLLAVVWDEWQEEYLSCSVVTQAADSSFETIHSRMPLLLTVDQARRWLDLAEPPKSLLNDLLGREVHLRATPVDPAINNARNKSAAIRIAEGFTL